MSQVVNGAHADLITDGTTITVRLRGEHDLFTVDAVSEVFASAVVLHGGDVVVDLGDVAFVDASTTHVLDRAELALAARHRALSIVEHSVQRVRALWARLTRHDEPVTRRCYDC